MRLIHPWRPGALLPVALIPAMLAGCSHESRCVTEGVEVALSGDHAHHAVVPPEDVKRGAPGVYAVHGDGHEHVIALREEDMRRLKEGQPVSTRTSSVNAHVHEVTIHCK